MTHADSQILPDTERVLPPVFDWFFASAKRLTVLIVLAVTAGTICYFAVDRPLAKWADTLSLSVNQLRQIVTRIGLSEWYLVTSGFLLFVYKLITRDPLPAWRSAVVLCCIGGSGLTVNLLKWIFGRYRPPMLLTEDQFGFAFFENGYMVHSFPSGHSATAASLVVLGCMFIPRLRWLWLVMGLLIAMSRIFVGAHFASDIIAGWIVGLIFSIYVCRKLKAPVASVITD